MTNKTQTELRRVLEAVADLSEPHPNQYVEDRDIAEKLSMDIQEVQDYLDILEQQRKTTSSKCQRGYSALLTAEGRIELRDPEFLANTYSHPTINLSGNFQGALLNIQSTLNHVTQTINSSFTFDKDYKETLNELMGQLSEELQKIPQNKQEEAEAIAEISKSLVDATSKEKPNKPLIQITADGLKKAAKNIADVLPTVTLIATQIIELILKQSH